MSGKPWFRVKVSPRIARFFVAGGARRAVDGQSITDAINEDSAEVVLLRESRRQAQAGQTTRMFSGICLIRRDTGMHQGHINFSEVELDLPNYVETIEKSYRGSQWRPVRVLRCPELEP